MEKSKNKEITNKKIKIFADNLNRILREKRISRGELAKKINCTYNAVTMWTSGKTFPNDGKITDLALALDVSLNELLEEPYEINVDAKVTNKFTELFLQLPRSKRSYAKYTLKACADLLKKEKSDKNGKK